jgi:hypothetical protein
MTQLLSPYGFCLLLTLPVLILGFLILHHSGVTAINGGFAHILMTTGRTGLEFEASKGCLGDKRTYRINC